MLRTLGTLVVALIVSSAASFATGEAMAQDMGLEGADLGKHLVGGTWSTATWSDTYEGGPLSGNIKSVGRATCRGTWTVSEEAKVTYTYTGKRGCRDNSGICIVKAMAGSDAATFVCGQYTYRMKRKSN